MQAQAQLQACVHRDTRRHRHADRQGAKLLTHVRCKHAVELAHKLVIAADLPNPDIVGCTYMLTARGRARGTGDDENIAQGAFVNTDALASDSVCRAGQAMLTLVKKSNSFVLLGTA